RMTHLLRLDGDDGAMTVDALRAVGSWGNQAHTVEAWIRPHGRPRVRSWPLLLGTPGAGAHSWLWASDGTVQLGVYGDPQRTVPLSVQQWTDLATVWDPTNGVYTIYSNGQAVAKTQVQRGGFDLQGVPLWLGRRELGFADDSNF